MTGAEHYAEAERLLALQTRPSEIPGCGPVIRADALPEATSIAQVHATLTLAHKLHELIEVVKLVPGAMP